MNNNKEHSKGKGIVVALITLITTVGAVILEYVLAPIVVNEYGKNREKTEEYAVRIQYNETIDDGETKVYQIVDPVPDAWFHMQGQIVIKYGEKDMVKTFIVQEMFGPVAYHIKEDRKISVCRKNYSVADQLEQMLEREVIGRLEAEGVNCEEFTVEEIGLACISVRTKDETNWIDYYYILQNDSFIRIDSKTADRKECGVALNKTLINDKNTMDDIFHETRNQLMQYLAEKQTGFKTK